MALYLGIDTAKANKHSLVGINDIAREIKYGYVGDTNSKAKSILGTHLPAKTTLELTSWEDIRTITKLGLASSYWKVGDRKHVRVTGALGTGFNFTTTMPNGWWCYIIGFDHNKSLESPSESTIHFQFGYAAASGSTSTDLRIAVDSSYGNAASSNSRFQMRYESRNTGGWADSHMRSDICDYFYYNLPPTLQAVINRNITKYTDNVGGGNLGNGSASSVTGTKDVIWLPSEFEVLGVRSGANYYEQSKQQQYAFWKGRDPRMGSQRYWTRSPNIVAGGGGCVSIHPTDGMETTNVNTSLGISPCFAV